MSWLVTSINVLRNIFGSGANPTKVFEVKQSKYSDRNIVSREDSIVLYEPAPPENKYEIVAHKAFCEQAYSLLRSDDREDAEVQFLRLKDKLPILTDLSSSMCNLYGIQKICDALREHPTWSIAHLAVYFNLTDCLLNETILSHLNTPDVETGESPLHLAVKCGNIAVIKTLVGAKASLEHLDHRGNSVFHYAASTNKDIIMVLMSSQPPKCLNYRNADGYTPLHLACRADKPDCVQTLLAQGADVNISASRSSDFTSEEYSNTVTPPGYVADFMQYNPKKLSAQDMKFGGTPLHWSSSREVIEALVERNCDINVVNFDHRTALHIMVMRNRLECVVALLSRQADLDVGDCDGNTALHLAVKQKNIPIVQALVVFGADLTLLNNSGQSARHLAAQEKDETSERILYMLHAVGAPRCASDTVKCTDGCSAFGTHNGQVPPVPPSAQVRPIMRCFENIIDLKKDTRGGRVLCLDGGGIRGLILVTVLLHLEEATGCPIIHCFDWVAGTSTGAILALALAAGKSLKESFCLYFRMKDHAFTGAKPYPSEPLETILQETLGSQTVMADITHPKLMITAVLADCKPVDLHIFRNYPSPSEMIDPDAPPGLCTPPPPPQEQLLWKAARASGAAPSYFRAFGRFLDGGLIANNPTLDVLTEIHEYNTALRALGRHNEVTPPTVVVSIGTGLIPLRQLTTIDIFRPGNMWDTARLAMGISFLATLIVDQATLADGRVIDRCNAWCSTIGVPYFRFSPQLSEDISMDEKSDEKLVNMLWETKAYIFSQDTEVRKLASLLNSGKEYNCQQLRKSPARSSKTAVKK